MNAFPHFPHLKRGVPFLLTPSHMLKKSYNGGIFHSSLESHLFRYLDSFDCCVIFWRVFYQFEFVASVSHLFSMFLLLLSFLFLIIGHLPEPD